MSQEVATRNDRGQFVKGASGNPSGRPVGVRNQTTLVKEAIENALVTEHQDDFRDIMKVAIRKAKSGDNQMIKLLLGDLLAEVRRESGERADNTINVNISGIKDVGVTIDHEESP